MILNCFELFYAKLAGNGLNKYYHFNLQVGNGTKPWVDIGNVWLDTGAQDRRSVSRRFQLSGTF